MSIDAVKLHEVGHAYHDNYALVGITTELPAGTCTALLGPNGAGKSTLISILSSLVRPTEGTVSLGRVTLHKPSPSVRALIGYVGHQTMLYPELSARENLHFFGRLYGVVGLAERSAKLLLQVGLSLDMDRPVSGFSRGMAQRAALARAVLHSPALLLLDEPFTGLDQSGVTIATELFTCLREEGAILLIASHDLAATERLTDRALILRGGRIVHDGPYGKEEGGLAAAYEAAIA